MVVGDLCGNQIQTNLLHPEKKGYIVVQPYKYTSNIIRDLYTDIPAFHYIFGVYNP